MKSLFKEILSSPYLPYRPKEKRKLIKNVKIKFFLFQVFFFWRGWNAFVLRFYRIDKDSLLSFNFSFFIVIFIVESIFIHFYLKICRAFFFSLFLILLWLLTNIFKSKFRAGREMLLKCIFDVVSAMLCFWKRRGHSCIHENAWWLQALFPHTEKAICVYCWIYDINQIIAFLHLEM